MSDGDLKILLVDDFEMIRLMLRNTLSDLGFKNVHEARDGKIALKMLTEGHDAGAPFSLVFCDWNMPELTGIDVLIACRKLPQFANLGFVMLTAEAEQEFVVKALSAGANDYIIKPVAPDILERKIKRVLARVKAA